MLAHSSVTSIDQQARLDAKLRRELGDVILHALADDRTEDIVLNPDSRIWIKRQGGGFQQAGDMPAAQAHAAIGTIAAQRSTVVNYDRPFLEAELPIDGSRFEGIVPPVTSRPVFAIRLRPRRIFTLNEYARGGILTSQTDPMNTLRRQALLGDRRIGILENMICRHQHAMRCDPHIIANV